jgi:formylglycine-generating enzyme required for sulfatase activity
MFSIERAIYLTAQKFEVPQVSWLRVLFVSIRRLSKPSAFVTLLLLLIIPPAHATQNRDAIAVIIGNKAYQHQDVPAVDFAHNDAEAMKRFVIDVLGYRERNVIDLRDATQAQLTSTFGNHSSHEGKLWSYVKEGKSDVTVFYSGHGVPGLKDQRGYLLPVDADPATVDLNGYPVDVLYENLAKLPAKSVTVYLDACFSGQTPKGALVRATSGLLVEPRPPKASTRVVVLTAARGDQVASWDEEAKQGLFTRYLLEALRGAADGAEYGDGDGTVSVGEVKRYLDEEMSYAAKRRYRRTQTATVTGDEAVQLAAVVVPKPVPEPSPGPPSFTVTALEQTMVVADVASLNVRDAPSGAKVGSLHGGVEVEVTGQTEYEGARWYRVAMARGGVGYVFGAYLRERPTASVTPVVGVFPKPAPSPSEHSVGDVFKDCDVCPEMVVVPAGEFMMGSEDGEANERPVHRVRIPVPFAVGKFEVTFDEWDACVSAGGCDGYRPADNTFGRGRRPVINVSWNNAQSYLAWLRQKTDKQYSLLSEGEWEYVARARTTTKFHTGHWIGSFQANFDHSKGKTAPAGSYGPNAFGLHDVHGNVWEWVEDCWNNNYRDVPSGGTAVTTGICTERVLRGGSWVDVSRDLRVANRHRERHNFPLGTYGFRITRTLSR